MKAPKYLRLSIFFIVLVCNADQHDDIPEETSTFFDTYRIIINTSKGYMWVEPLSD